MSDRGPDSGWWLATDGKWYPPELHPDVGGRIGIGFSSASESVEEYDEEFDEDTVIESIRADEMHDLHSLDEHHTPEDAPVEAVVAEPEEPSEPSEPEELVGVEVNETEVAEPTESPVADDHREGPELDGSLPDKLLELSNRRVAGFLSDDEFAEAQRRLLTGEDAEP